MRYFQLAAIALTVFFSSSAFAQECAEGCNQGGGWSGWMSGVGGGGYGGGYGGAGGGIHGEMFPYDQQDPWLHGHHQQAPSYAGYNSFRPYNYRHVAAQQQVAAGWGASRGMNYSQQFWNKYEGAYLNEDLHAGQTPAVQNIQNQPQPSYYPAAHGQPVVGQAVVGQPVLAPAPAGRPVVGQPVIGQPVVGQPGSPQNWQSVYPSQANAYLPATDAQPLLQRLQQRQSQQNVAPQPRVPNSAATSGGPPIHIYPDSVR